MNRWLSVMVSAVFFVSALSSGATADWDRTFGGRNDDFGECVAPTSDGGYIIVGTTWSHGAGYADVWLIKVASNGYRQWQKTFAGTRDGKGHGVQQTTDGGYIVVGETWSGANVLGDGLSDVLLVKTDKDGNRLWEQRFGSEDGIDAGYGVRQTTDGGYIIIGYTSTYGEVDSKDIWLIKTDSAGNMEWNKRFCGVGDDRGYDVQQTTDGGYILVGYNWIDEFLYGWTAVWLGKTDANGNLKWQKNYSADSRGKGGTQKGYSVQQTRDGGYILVATVGHGPPMWDDIWLIKTNAKGAMQWDKVFDSSDYDGAFCVRQTSDDGYIIAGHKSHWWSLGAADAWVIKTDASGYMEWDETFGGDGTDVGKSVLETSDGGYVIVGYTGSYGAGGHDRATDVWLIKTFGPD